MSSSPLVRAGLVLDRRTRRVSRVASVALCAAIGGLSGFLAPHGSHAGDPEDWSLERSASDPALVSQRMSKLRRSPFDPAQWRSLLKALGTEGLGKTIRRALARDPDDLALLILDARITLAEGNASGAAEKLAAIEPKAGRYADPVFALRLHALEEAGSLGTAAKLLEERAKTHADVATRTRLLERAYGLADRGGRTEEALRLAEAIGKTDPDDIESILRLARAATRAGQHSRADGAYARAIEAAGQRRRDELVAERARARLDADNAAGSAELLWSLLESPRRGSKAARAVWWDHLADAHQGDGSSNVLAHKLERWLEDHGDEAAAWRTLAETKETAGLDPIEAWRKAVELQPRDTEAHTALIGALEVKGRTTQAVEEFRRLLARSTRDVQVGLDLAGRLVAAGDRELGFQVAREIEAKAGRREHALMLLLDFYNLSDEPELALRTALKLAKVAPRKPEVRIALGEQLYQMNRVPEALHQWSMLPKLIRPAHKGWARHAEVLSEHGRTSEAVGALKRALGSVPEDPGYLRLRAVLSEEQRRPTQALELWEQVRMTATAPEQSLLRDEARTRVVELLVGGSIPKRRNKVERAEADALLVLEAGKPLPDAIEAGRFLAELHTRQENYTAAVKVQHRLLELQPENAGRLEQLAAAQRRAGQVKSALGTLEDLLSNEPSRSGDVLAEMSELAFEAGDDEGALDAATRAAKKERHHVEALVRLGELHEQRGDIDAAAEAYDQALETIPGNARARLRLAELELTRGDVGRASMLLREVLDRGGPPELLREAGRRALDLAEATGDPMELVELAVRRTTRQPEADEPREFLLEALDRVDSGDVEGWLAGKGKRGGAKGTTLAQVRDRRGGALRQPLVVSLSRGSVGARLRAAEHLGRLRLPETALPLAQMGASLSPPRDSTATVREVFERARLTALRAAGQQQDPDAVAILATIVGDPSYTMASRQTAAWGLARSGTAQGAAALTPHVSLTSDPLIAALGCVALAARPRDQVSGATGQAVAELARQSRQEWVRHVCAYAEAALTPDRSVARLHAMLDTSDPVVAAVAAWRLGQVESPDASTIEALLRRYIGPAGLPRDAAGAALHRLLSEKAPSETDRVPPAVRTDNWSMTLRRWLQRRLAPAHDPLPPAALAPHHEAVAAALHAAGRGTRAEQAAAKEAQQSCSHSSAGPTTPRPRSSSQAQVLSICLRPLVAGPVPLARN